MIPIDLPSLPRYRVLYWDGSEPDTAGGHSCFNELVPAEVVAMGISKIHTETVVEVWDVLLVCPMAWYQAGKLGWHR